MHSSLGILIRTALGISLLLIGIMFLFLPILKGWLLVLASIPLISPQRAKSFAYALYRRNSDRKS